MDKKKAIPKSTFRRRRLTADGIGIMGISAVYYNAEHKEAVSLFAPNLVQLRKYWKEFTVLDLDENRVQELVLFSKKDVKRKVKK